MSYQTPRILLTGIHLGWAVACATRKDPASDWLARDNPETNPITIKPETASQVAEQFPWVPLLCCSLPRHPFPIKSLALSARVSPRTIHFQVLDKSPLSGPGRGPPSCNKMNYQYGKARTFLHALWTFNSQSRFGGCILSREDVSLHMKSTFASIQNVSAWYYKLIPLN